MRFILLVKAGPGSEAVDAPAGDLMAGMAAFHDALAQAGVLLDASALQPSAQGWRIGHAGGRRTVHDGPFAETQERVAGYALIQVRSRAEAMEWSRRFPAAQGSDCEIEVRPLLEQHELPPNPSGAPAYTAEPRRP